MSINSEILTKDFVEFTAIDRESYNEREIADELISRLEALGFTVDEDDAGDFIGGNAGNIYAYLDGTIPGDPILFSSHMDTVSPGKDKKAIVDGDIIKSDGTTVLGGDDLTGILSILHGVQAVIESGAPRRDIEILFTVAEEVFTKGAKAFDYSNIHAKDAYVLDVDGEPGEVAISAPSIVQFKATMVGRAAHAGFAPETGINAIAAMTKAVSQMKQGRPDPDSTFNVGTITGGLATNIVSEECSIKAEARSFDHAKCEAIIEENHQILLKVAEEFGAELKYEPIVAARACSVSEDAPVVQRVTAACRAVGLEPVLKKTFGVSDGNYFATKGLPAAIIATGMSSVHSTKEYCSISTMVKVAELIGAICQQED